MNPDGTEFGSELERARGWFWEDLESGCLEGSFSIGFVESGKELQEVAQVAIESLRSIVHLEERDPARLSETAVLWKLDNYVTLISLDSSLTRTFGLLLASVSKGLGARICAFESTGHDAWSWKSLVLVHGTVVDRFSMCPENEIDGLPSATGLTRDENDRLALNELDDIERYSQEDPGLWSEAEAAMEEDRKVARRYWKGSGHYHKSVANFFNLDDRIVLAHLDQFSERNLAQLPRVTSKGRKWRPALATHEEDWFSRGHPFGWIDLPRHAGLKDIDLFPGVWSICKSSSVPESVLTHHGLRGPIRLR